MQRLTHIFRHYLAPHLLIILIALFIATLVFSGTYNGCGGELCGLREAFDSLFISILALSIFYLILSRKKYSWGQRIVFLLTPFVAIAGAYLFVLSYKYRLGLKEPPRPSIPIFPSMTNSITSTPTLSISLDTINWQTHQNSKQEFLFKYPANYILSDKNFAVDSESCALFHKLELYKDIYADKGQYPAIALSAIKTSKNPQQFIDDCFEKELTNWRGFQTSQGYLYPQEQEPKIESIIAVSYGSIQAQKVEKLAAPNAPNRKVIEYVFKKDQIIYVLSANYGTFDPEFGEDGSELIQILETIFQTFRFF